MEVDDLTQQVEKSKKDFEEIQIEVEKAEAENKEDVRKLED